MASAFVAPILGGLAGLFGGGNQQKTKTSGTIDTNATTSQTGTNTGTSTTSNFGTVTPNLSPFQTQLASLFTKGASDLYNQSTNLGGYTQGGIEGINNTSNLNDKVLQNTLASRGLSYSPAAGNAEVQNQLSRAGQINQFTQGIPLLQRQMQQQSLSQLMQAFGVLPTGQTSTGGSTTDQSQTSNVTGTSHNTQNQNGTNLVSGNPVAGAIGGAGAGLFAPINGNGDTAFSQLLNMFGGNKGSGNGNNSGGELNFQNGYG